MARLEHHLDELTLDVIKVTRRVDHSYKSARDRTTSAIRYQRLKSYQVVIDLTPRLERRPRRRKKKEMKVKAAAPFPTQHTNTCKVNLDDLDPLPHIHPMVV